MLCQKNCAPTLPTGITWLAQLVVKSYVLIYLLFAAVLRIFTDKRLILFSFMTDASDRAGDGLFVHPQYFIDKKHL